MNSNDMSGKSASIRARLKFKTEWMFIENYAPNISKNGIFVKTPQLREVGTRVKFEFQLADGSPVMRGLGKVVWTRSQESKGEPIGMGIEFIKLDPASQNVLDRVMEFKNSETGKETAPSRYTNKPSEPKLETAPQPQPAVPSEASAPTLRRVRARKEMGIDLNAVDSMLAEIAGGLEPLKERKLRRRKPVSREPLRQMEPIVQPQETEPETQETVSETSSRAFNQAIELEPKDLLEEDVKPRDAEEIEPQETADADIETLSFMPSAKTGEDLDMELESMLENDLSNDADSLLESVIKEDNGDDLRPLLDQETLEAKEDDSLPALEAPVERSELLDALEDAFSEGPNDSSEDDPSKKKKGFLKKFFKG